MSSIYCQIRVDRVSFSTKHHFKSCVYQRCVHRFLGNQNIVVYQDQNRQFRGGISGFLYQIRVDYWFHKASLQCRTGDREKQQILSHRAGKKDKLGTIETPYRSTSIDEASLHARLLPTLVYKMWLLINWKDSRHRKWAPDRLMKVMMSSEESNTWRLGESLMRRSSIWVTTSV